MTDYWRPYREFISPERHIQSKSETFTVEGYNSLFRHFLGRKSKCYSKSLLMGVLRDGEILGSVHLTISAKG
jgi:insertion element IS1 protein InsB